MIYEHVEIANEILNKSQEIYLRYDEIKDEIKILMERGEINKRENIIDMAVRKVLKELYPNAYDFHFYMIYAAILKQETEYRNKHDYR